MQNISNKMHSRPEEAVLNERIGMVLRLARRSKGMSLEQIAASLNISQQQLWKHEVGLNRLTLSRFIKIMQLLEIEPAEFIQTVLKQQ